MIRRLGCRTWRHARFATGRSAGAVACAYSVAVRSSQTSPVRAPEAAAAAREERLGLRGMVAGCGCAVCSLGTGWRGVWGVAGRGGGGWWEAGERGGGGGGGGVGAGGGGGTGAGAGGGGAPAGAGRGRAGGGGPGGRRGPAGPGAAAGRWRSGRPGVRR